MSNTRLAYIDIAKGLLISIVVFHHIAFQANMAGITNGCIQWNFTFLPFYSSWFMPAFFIITGYCSNFRKTFKDFILNNLSTLLWPMISFYVITSLLKVSSLSCDSLVYDLSIGINWFLTALFISKIIYFYAYKYLANEAVRIICLLFLSILAIICNDIDLFGFNWIHYRHALYLTFFLGFGQWLKNNNALFEKAIKYSWIVFWCLFAVCRLMKIEVPGIAGVWINFNAIHVPLHILMAISGSCMVIGLSKLIAHNKLLEFIGNNSLVFYLAHAPILGFVVRLVVAYIIDPKTKQEALGYNCVVWAISIIICIVLSVLFNNRRLSWIVKLPI